MRDFRKLNIWTESMEIVTKVYLLSNELSDDEKFGLKPQIQRAAVSIPSNIAEGAGRGTDKEFKRFLEIALGSAFELETQVLIIKEIYAINSDCCNDVLNLVNQNQKRISALLSKINTSLKN